MSERRIMVINKFLDYLLYQKRYSENTINAYNSDLLQFAKYLTDQYEIGSITECDRFQVRSWMVSMVGSGMSARSINRKVVTLRSFFRWCMREGITVSSPVDGLAPMKVGKRLPEYVDEEAMKTLLDQVMIPEDFEGLRNRAIIELLYQTGMRLSELISIKRGQVEGMTDHIKVLGKRNKERVIPVGRNMSVLLGRYIAVRDEKFGSDGSSSLFLTNRGNILYRKFVYRLVNQSLAAVTTITRRSPHIIRHSFATAMLNHGADINAVKELLGHSSLASTQVYTHNTAEKLKRVYRQAHPRA